MVYCKVFMSSLHEAYNITQYSQDSTNRRSCLAYQGPFSQDS